jgi:hypothetical protein
MKFKFGLILKLFGIINVISLICSLKLKSKKNRLKNSQSIPVNISFQYPYTCGTWFNRGKNTCHDIIKKLEENKFNVNSSIKGFHKGDPVPQGEDYNGEFNIFLINRNTYPENSNKILLSTSDQSSKYYHPGLKYFAYTFYRYDNGEKNYLEDFPQKKELLDYVLKRLIVELNKN